MNGRIYDPLLGRFLQADPFIQAASNTQSYNRYSYGFNNPLNGTDPSGYLFGIDDVIAAFVIGAFIGEAGRQLDIPLLQAIGSAVSCIGGNVAVCGAAAFGSTLGYTHDFGMALQSGFFATMSAAAFSSVGVEFNGTPLEGGWAHIGAHAFTGGVMSVLQGGKFGHGFVSAGFTKAAKINNIMPNNAEYLADTVRVVAAAVVGGTVSKVTGGKFANGAATAAFAQAFNGNGAIERRNAQKEQARIDRYLKEVLKDYPQLQADAEGKNILATGGPGVDGDPELDGRWVSQDLIKIAYEGRSEVRIKATIFHELLHVDEAMYTSWGNRKLWLIHEAFDGGHDPWVRNAGENYRAWLHSEKVGGTDLGRHFVRPNVELSPWRK